MNILIIGQGGREHALAWKITQSPHVKKVFIAPGNAGTHIEKRIENIDINALDIPALIDFAQSHRIDLTIVGPEAPLAMGIVDKFHEAGLTIFGPTQAAAQLESSKTFAKNFLVRHQIPTAHYQSFTQITEALEYIKTHDFPLVIKADGLAAGKGVVIATNYEEAECSINDMLMGNILGQAGHRIVIEEFLSGEEASFIVVSDGDHVIPLATSQDHKRVGNGDTGPNTGGMGAYSPAPVVTSKVHKRVMEHIVWPTVRGMAAENMPYTGFLYVGLMIDKKGEPKVIEFNCRLGDPETQPLMLRLQSDLAELCMNTCEKKLAGKTLNWDPRPALGIVMAAEGYPGDYVKGQVIKGLSFETSSEQKIFHAGTCIKNNEILTDGGRVLCATAMGQNIEGAQKNAYALVKSVNWHGCFYRNDIGYRAFSHS